MMANLVGKATAPAQAAPKQAQLQTSMTPLMMKGAWGSLILLVILVVWATFTQISGAVIAQGQVVAQGHTKQVQNLDGGIVAEILVKNGDLVREGDLLMRLDPTLLRVNLDIARNRLADAMTQKARLEAEQLDLPEIDFSALHDPVMLAHLGGLSLDKQQAGQTQIFVARREVLHGTTAQLGEKIAQIENQRDGTLAGIAAKQEQLVLLQKELENVTELNKQGLARESQVLDLQRTQSEMLGQISEQESELARLANSVRDAQMEILQTARTFKEEVVTKLRETTNSAEELILQIVTTQKQLDRVEIRAPSDGVVHEMQAATIGGVVAAGATILQIVPSNAGYQYELRLDPRSIDQVFVGQETTVKFPAFSSRSTPDIFGKVSVVSPASVTDTATGQVFYRLELEIPPQELAKLGDLELVPGMPVEAFVQTSNRSVLSYLTQPLAEQMARAFRDD
jgi:HlyD family secretion protein